MLNLYILRNRKMALNAREIKLRLLRVAQVSINSGCSFIQKHPVISGALLVFCIIYIFLSYIYNFLAYLSPFLVVAAIFVRIFWSSEQTQLKYVKTSEEKRGERRRKEPKYPKIPKYGRRDLVTERKSKYLPQHATNRRRNFRERTWDVQGGFEERANELSTAYGNDLTRPDSKEVRSFEKGGSSLGYGLSADKFQAPQGTSLRSEPSMRDLVVGYGLDGQNTRYESGWSDLETDIMDDGDDEDEEEEEEEAQEDRNKVVEWTEDDQKNLMDLGISEIERNRRLESLVARRRASKLLKLQTENGLIDNKNDTPSQIPPKDFDDIHGLEIPGSAPSVLRSSRSPFDLRYDPSKEKRTLIGDSFHQEFTKGPQKDMAFRRHESFSLGQSYPRESIEDLQELGVREPYPIFINERKVSDGLGDAKFRRLPDMGHHDWLIEQLFSKQGTKSKGTVPNPQRKREETTYQVDRNTKTDMVDMRGDEVENVYVAKSTSAHSRGSHLKSLNDERSRVSEKLELRLCKPRHEKLLNCPVSNSTNITEPLSDPFPSPISNNQENNFSPGRRICHTPSYSLASDLQVEFSEIGSPTLTVDGSNTSSDGDSLVYDGDVDKDITSGSDDFWGNSLHSREVPAISEDEIAEENNDSKDALQILLNQIDEENSADVSSISSRPDLPEDTPTHAVNYDRNIFANVREGVVEIEAPYPLSSSEVPSPQKHLTHGPADHPPSTTPSEKAQEWCNLQEVLTNEAEVVNEANHLATIEKDNTENLTSIENPGPSTLRQESIDDISVNPYTSFSPRSVLPEKALTDQVPSSDFNQQMHMDAARFNMEDRQQTILNAELPPDSMPQNGQPLIEDQPVQSHNGDLSNSQETSYSSNMAHDASITDRLSKPIFDDAEREQRTSYEAIAGIIEASTSDVAVPLDSKTLENSKTSNIPGKKDPADHPENSIEEENIYGRVNEAEFSNKEDEEKLKNNENGEHKPTSQLKQDAAVDSPGLAKMRSPKAMDEKSKESVDDRVTIHPSTTREETKISGSVAEHETILFQLNPVKDVDADTGAKKDVQGDSVDYKESTNLTEKAAAADSIEISTVNEVPSNTMMLESSSEVVKQNEDKFHTSMGQEATAVPIISAETTDSPSAKDLAEKHDDLNVNDKLRKIAHSEKQGELAQLADVNPSNPDNPNHSSKEVSYLHNDSNELFEDDMKKESPQPNVTESTKLRSAEDNEGISDEVNKRHTIEQELNKNGSLASIISEGESDKVIDTEHMEEPEEVVQLDDSNLQKPVITNDSSEAVGNTQSKSKELVEDDTEDKLTIGKINEDLPQPLVSKPMFSNEGHAEDS